MIVPSTSIAVPSSSSGAHRCTLEFITEVAQELYAKGQLCVKPYAGYLKVQTYAVTYPRQSLVNM